MDLDSIRNEDQREIAKAVRAIAQDFGYEYSSKEIREGGGLKELWQVCADAGFVGLNIPTEYGGGGQGMSELIVVIEELYAEACGLGMLVVSPSICGSVIARHGTQEQREKWLPGLADGTKVMAFAITEPDAGTNTHNLAVAARRDGSDWILKGTKYFITGIDRADAALVVAKTGTRDDGRGELSLFLVPTDSANLSLSEIEVEAKMPESQFFVNFDDVRLPADALIGEPGQGLRMVFDGLNPERIAGAATGLGTARYALNKATKYANERRVWGPPIGSYQGLAHPLSEQYIKLQLARGMTYHAAAVYDSGADAGEVANIAKYASAEAALGALDQAIQTHGGNGLTIEFGLADQWFATRLMHIAPVSREMILNYISQHSLGLPRSY